MSSLEDASADAGALAVRLERALAENALAALTPAALQALMAVLCRTYAARVDAGETLLPVAPRAGVSDTVAMVVASGMLRANNLAVFELGMWQSWAGG